MRFERLKAHNIGPFRDVDIDIANAPGPLVAVTGANGAGKSTLLELCAGALYRQTPTRGTLADLATARDASVEITAVNGQRFSVRQIVDQVSGKGEAVAMDASGTSLLESAKVTAYDAWASRHVVPSDVLYCSAFQPQGSAGFLDLKPAERKRMLLRMLQIEKLEALAKLARDRVVRAQAQVTTLRARLDDLRARTPDAEAARADVERCARERDAVAEALRAAQERLDVAKASDADVAEAQRRWERRGRLLSDRDRLRSEWADVQTRLANNRAVLADAVAIEAAAKAVDDATVEIARLKVERAERAAQVTTAKAGLDAAVRDVVSKRQARDSHQRALETVARDVADAPTVRAAVARVAELDADLEALQGARAAAQEEIERVTNAKTATLDQRIDGLRDGLSSIRGGAPHPVEVAAGALERDDAAVGEAGARPMLLADLFAAAQNIDAAMRKLRGERTPKGAVAARLPAVERAETELDRLRSLTEDLVSAAVLAEHTVDEAKAALQQRESALVAHDAATSAVVDAAAPHRALAARLEPLRNAGVRVEELEPRLAQLATDVDRLDTEIAALPDTPPGTSDVSGAQAAVDAATTKLRTVDEALSRARVKVEEADSGACAIAAREAEIRDAEAEQADWTRLAADLGRDGLQALEIDAAIPELNALANQLLHECHGSRFTVEVSSTRLSADGKRVLEDLDVRVVDTERGRDAAVETYSGGECVIVGEALSLALTMIACRRAGLERPTIVRDESGAALDPANGRAYISMLRRAAQLIDADKVLFVSHTPELQELADSRIVVGGGTAVLA